VVYLGFLIPFLLPPELGLLASLCGSGQIYLPFRTSPEQQEAQIGGEILRHPRVRAGPVVLERQAWTCPLPSVPVSAKGEADGAYFLRLNQWRHSLNMPDQVFVRPRIDRWQMGDLETMARRLATTRTKPQFIDFTSPLLTKVWDKMVKEMGEGGEVDALLVEEVLPAPREGPFVSTAGSHSGELVVEFDRPPKAR